MNSICNINKIERFMAWVEILRPNLLNVLNGNNAISWGELFTTCTGNCSRLSRQFHNRDCFFAELLFALENLFKQHIQNTNLIQYINYMDMERFCKFWKEYNYKIKTIKNLLCTATPNGNELHANLFRMFLRQICKIETMENVKCRESLKFRIANFRLEQLLDIKMMQNFLERCCIFLINGPPTLFDICARKICIEFDIDALPIPSTNILKEKIYAERENWPIPIGRESKNCCFYMTSAEKKAVVVPQFYKDCVVVAQNELKLYISDFDVRSNISTEVGNFSVSLQKYPRECLVFINELQNGLVDCANFELFAYACTANLDESLKQRAEMFYAKIRTSPEPVSEEEKDGDEGPSTEEEDIYIKLQFVKEKPIEPIRNILNKKCQGWEIVMDKEQAKSFKYFLFTIRLLNDRSAFPDYMIASAQRPIEISVNDAIFYVNKEVMQWCDRKDYPNDQENSEFFGPFFAENARLNNVNQARPNLVLEGFLQELGLENIEIPQLTPSEIFQEFLLVLLHPILPNRDNVAFIWSIASSILAEKVLEKCRSMVKLANEMDIVVRMKLAGKLGVNMDKMVNIFSKTSDINEVDKALHGLIKRGRFDN